MAKKESKKPSTGALVVRAPKTVVALDRDGVKSVARVLDAMGDWIDAFEDGHRRVSQLMLTEIFDEDARAMLRADRGSNPRWRELLRRVPGQTGLSAKAVSVLARVGAYDELITGRYWKRLEPGLKERLLPLADRKDPGGRPTLSALDRAAKHCLDFDLDGPTAARFVDETLRQTGRHRRRSASRRTYETQVERTLDLFGDAAGLERFAEVSEALDETAREELSAKLERAAKRMLAAAKGLRRR